MRRTVLAALSLALAACAGTEERATGHLAAGRVLDGSGLPVAGLLVAAGAGGRWEAFATTDPQGDFLVAVSAVPFDLAVVEPASLQGPQVTVYQGLTRTDLHLRARATPGHLSPVGRIGALDVSTGAFCSGPSCPSLLVGFTGLQGAPRTMSYGYFSPAGVPSRQLLADWEGPERLTGRYHALVWPASGPATYWYGFQDVELPAGGTARVELAPLAPLPTGTVSGSVSAPAGITVDSITLAHAFEGARVYLVSRSGPAGASFLLDVPSAPGLASLVGVEGTGPGGEQYRASLPVAAGQGGLSLALQPAADLVLPADGAADVGPGTVFSWYPTAGGISWLMVGPVTVVTQASVARLPDLAPFGVAYPAGQSGAWGVVSTGPLAGVDDFAGPDAALAWWQSFSAPRALVFR